MSNRIDLDATQRAMYAARQDRGQRISHQRFKEMCQR